MLWYLQSIQGLILVRHLYTSKTPSQQTNCVLCRYITYSRDHRPLSKLLRHTMLQILQWNKQPSGMTSGRLFHWRILALRVLPIRILLRKQQRKLLTQAPNLINKIAKQPKLPQCGFTFHPEGVPAQQFSSHTRHVISPFVPARWWWSLRPEWSMTVRRQEDLPSRISVWLPHPLVSDQQLNDITLHHCHTLSKRHTIAVEHSQVLFRKVIKVNFYKMDSG